MTLNDIINDPSKLSEIIEWYGLPKPKPKPLKSKTTQYNDISKDEDKAPASKTPDKKTIAAKVRAYKEACAKRQENEQSPEGETLFIIEEELRGKELKLDRKVACL